MATVATRTLLLVDDEPAQVRLVSAIAGRAGWRTLPAADGDRAIEQIARGGEAIDAVLIDAWRPAGGGAALVEAMRRRWPMLPIVMLTAETSIDLAVAAMRAGATDFLIKPLAPERLMAALDAAVDAGRPEGELRPLSEKVVVPLGFDEIVGSAPAFRTALAQAAKAARSRAPTLIVGAPGTGKDLIARAIHAASPRGRRPLVTVRVAGVASSLVSSELFGHERDAFPGAFQHSIGRIAQAEGGTVLVAGVDALDPDAQGRLLTLIDEGQSVPVGARGGRMVDVRVIALARAPLADAVAAGRFRADLAERLSATMVTIPPLAARTADIAPLARHLLGRIGRQPGMPRLGIADDALALLAGHAWPGNVRQLHDALFRAAIGTRGAMLTAEDFPDVGGHTGPLPAGGVSTDAAGIHLYHEDGHLRPLEEIEADIIRLAIGHYGGRMTEVARRLGIGRSTLYRKLGELGLDSAA